MDQISKPLWTGPIGSREPPTHVEVVRDEDDGAIAERMKLKCQYCDFGGNVWRWSHNGNFACWYDLDGIGPWTEVE